MFGRDALREAPYLRIEELEDSFVVEGSSSILESVSGELRAQVRAHLGENAFMAVGRWRYSDGMAPRFE